MTTGTTTNVGKLPAGLKKFHRRALKRKVAEDTGRVLILDIAYGTHFSNGVFPDCEEHRATVEYDTAKETIYVHVEGRNLRDYQPPVNLVIMGFSLGERRYKAWPYRETTATKLRDMPSGDVKFLLGHLK